MLYNSCEELPEEIKAQLPKVAQEAYLKAFNDAWMENGEPQYKINEDLELRAAVAHEKAWAMAHSVCHANDNEIS